MNAVPCLTWVRRGIAKSMPEKVQLSKDELKRIIEETKDALDEADDKEWSDVDSDEESDVENSEGAAANPKSKKQNLLKLGKRKKENDALKKEKKVLVKDEDEEEFADVVNKYRLDDYDETDPDSVNPLHGIGKLAFYSTNDDDPYLTLKDDDSDTEDYEIKPTDNLIIAGRAQDDACLLEIYVYNEVSGSCYIHHDILLPSFPLAVEWLNYDCAEDKPGNFVAVGTMLPNIDIWDLDLVDSLEPVTTLEGKVKKKSAKKKVSSSGHTDSVLDLSWNSIVRNVLASGSVDCSVGVWDLTQGKIVTSLKQHTDKVQCVKWHPFEAQSLLSGSFDNTVKVYDCRSPDAAHKSWNLNGEIERVMWNQFSPFNFLACTDKGMVYCLDVRTDKPVYTLSAHSEAVSGLCLSSGIADMLITASTDHTVKIWDTKDNKPSMILEKDLQMDGLHCVSCCPEAPYVLAVGGTSQLRVWDSRESATVKKHFEGHALGGGDQSQTEPIEIAELDASTAMETLNLENEDSTNKKTKKKRRKTKKLK